MPCRALAALLLTGLCTPAAAASAQASAVVSSVYRYVDERGVVHFSDAPVDSQQLRERARKQCGYRGPPVQRRSELQRRRHLPRHDL